MTDEQVRTSILSGLPAYFYPWPGSVHWQRVVSLPPGSILVLDPADGPGCTPDPSYVEAVARVRSEADVRIFGYVDTGYALRAAVDVVADARLFRQWYDVDGVFLDRVLPMSEHLPYYTSISNDLREERLGIALNPGQPRIEHHYFELAEHVVVFEGGYEGYVASDFPPQPRGPMLASAWHLVYDVPTEETMREVVTLARARGAALLFVTDGSMPNPWDRLPTYWTQQIGLLAEGGAGQSCSGSSTQTRE